MGYQIMKYYVLWVANYENVEDYKNYIISLIKSKLKLIN